MSLVRHHNLASGAPLITLFGYSTTPADNVAYSTSPTPVTPPSGMLAGDLVYCSQMCASGGTVTFGISNNGGQSWNVTTDRNSALPAIRTLWCTFNGTWSANPSFSANAGGVAKSVQMFVFRPAKIGATWAVDQPVVMGGSTGTSGTTTGAVNTQNRVVTIVRNVLSTEAATYSSHSPGSFSRLGGNFRNTSTNNKNILYFFKVQSIGGDVGDLTLDVNVSATYYKSMHSFYYT
jgi:hypothetical protein